MKREQKGAVRLNLGSGPKAIPGWINIDYSFSLRLSKIKWFYKIFCKFFNTPYISWDENIRIMDVRKRFQFPDKSADAIIAMSLFEHLTFREGINTFKECFRVLKDDGILRVVVPDFYYIIKQYIEKVDREQKGVCLHEILDGLGFFYIRQPGGILKRLFWEGLSHSKHRYMYDEWLLKECLFSQGFSCVERKRVGQSLIADIGMFESIQSNDDPSALLLEAVK